MVLYRPACCRWLGKKETQLLPETKEECKRYLIRLLMMGNKMSSDSEVLNSRKEMREATGELIAEGILSVNGKGAAGRGTKSDQEGIVYGKSSSMRLV